jgi:hypothetical protein
MCSCSKACSKKRVFALPIKILGGDYELDFDNPLYYLSLQGM